MKVEKTPFQKALTWLGVIFGLSLVASGAWLLLWMYRLTKAVFLPGNLQIELHWVEVGLLLLLSLDLLVVILRGMRGPRLYLHLADGKLRRISRPVVIGSEPGEGEIRVDGVQVSRRHAELIPSGVGSIVLRDLGSTNGTFLSGAEKRLEGDIRIVPGQDFCLGLSGPRLSLSADQPAGILSSGWRLGLVLLFLWSGFFLGWRANLALLPATVIRVGNVTLDYGVFRNSGVFLALGLVISLLLVLWTISLTRLKTGPGLAIKQVHRGVQLLAITGAIILYSLFPASSVRFAYAAQRAERSVDATAGTGVYHLLQQQDSNRSSLEDFLRSFRGKSSKDDMKNEEVSALVSRFRSGQRALRLASNLGAQSDRSLLSITYFRQLLGLGFALVCFLLLPQILPGLRLLSERFLRWLSRPLFKKSAGFWKNLLYPDLILGLFAAVVVVLTIATPLGTSLGRGKNLWLKIPGFGTVQSIELVKAMFLLFMAAYFSRIGRLLELAPRSRYLVPFLLATGGAIASTAVQADMGGLLMLSLLVSGVFILGTGAWRLIASVPIMLGLGLGLALILGGFSIITTRFGLWLDPRHYWNGSQVVEARQLLLSSGLMGFSPHRMLASKITDIQGDLVIAALTERYGFLGLVALLAIWATIALALLATARQLGRSKTTEALLLGGVSVLLVVQVFTQCGGVLGLMPFTGVPLPWLSHGLTASLIFSFMLGLALAGSEGAFAHRVSEEKALSRKRLRIFEVGSAGLFFLVGIVALYWLVLLPQGGRFGPRGRDYRWVDVTRVRRIQGLIDAGVFARLKNTSRIRVDQNAYRKWRDEQKKDPGLLKLLREADGLRFKNGNIVPLPYLVSDSNRFAKRALPRGWILDRSGLALAMNDRREHRLYPLKDAAVQITGLPEGLSSGMGLEAAADGILTGATLNRATRLQAFRFDIQSGADLILTLDAGLQRKAYRLLDGRRGAAVVMDLTDGGLLALASSPSVDPTLAGTEGWKKAVDNPTHPLLNRAIATTNYYSPPGSTFKVIMAALSLLNSDLVDASAKLKCNGYDEEYDVRCAHGRAHGEVDLARALTVSCNIYFAHLAVELGRSRLLDGVQHFGFNQDNVLNLASGLTEAYFPVAPSTVEIPDTGFNDRSLARVGFGQGPVSATPLAMARAGAVLATGGTLLTPHLVEGYALGKAGENGSREILWEKEIPAPKAERVIPRHVAHQLSRQLREVFEDPHGTAHRLPALWHGSEGWRLDQKKPGEDWERIPMAGKTGSAWKTEGDRTDDAWMLVWAPAKHPRIIACVLVEDAGSGGRVAGPIAVELIREGLELRNDE